MDGQKFCPVCKTKVTYLTTSCSGLWVHDDGFRRPDHDINTYGPYRLYVSCQWCTEPRPDTPGTCPTCYRFPNMAARRGGNG